MGITQGEVNTVFWLRLAASFTVFSLVVLIGFPVLGRWFFKREGDSISQYIFVLVMIYLAALLAELAGLEGIIGAFFAGLALNRLIPHTSALMNRIEFVGNAIFINFFLISVGMLIDFSVFLKDSETIKVVIAMTVTAVVAKYLAAYFTQKTFGYTKPEGNLIFSLSVSHAAAILAVVLIGYNIVIGENEEGEPIRLLNESVLNGSIILILVSCTLSSFLTQKTGTKIIEDDSENSIKDVNPDEEKILMAVNYESTIQPLTNLALMLKSKKNTDNIFVTNIISSERNESSEKNAEKILETSVKLGASADIHINPLLRFDSDVQKGIANAIKENKITDLLLTIDPQRGFSPSFSYHLYYGYLQNQNTNVFVYQSVQPISTIVKHLVIFPEKAHFEKGFFHCLGKIWNIGKNSGATIVFYGHEDTIALIEEVKKKVSIEAEFIIFKDWNNLQTINKNIKENEALIFMMSKPGMISYQPEMVNVLNEINGSLNKKNCLLIYPYEGEKELNVFDRSVNNPEDFAQIGNIIGRIFR